MSSSIPGPAGLPRALSELDRTLVMGVLNVTPDSFSDGGRYLEPGAAIARGRQLVGAGADLVDVGGESTRPGAERIPLDEELRRVLPVVRELASLGVLVSIDTMRAEVAAQALAAGAILVNDVSGGLADPEMLGFVATTHLPYVVMHWRGPSTVMAGLAEYDDVVRDVRSAHGSRRRYQRASTLRTSSSTRGWGSPRTLGTTGRCSRTSTRSPHWVGRCWSGHRASGSSASW